MKFTKIVCTIGPASEKIAMLEKLIKAGMNVARLNFSHGSYKSHAKLIKNIRAAAKKRGEPVAILQDLQGPRIRIGEVREEGVQLKRGESVVLVPQEMYTEKSRVKMLPNHYAGLAKDVKSSQHILIADGLIDLRIVKVSGPEIHCTVFVEGVVKSHKGINVPGASISISSITQKDKDDVLFGAAHGVDYVALSFVRNAKDVVTLRSILKRYGRKHPHANRIGIFAKIERAEAVENIDEIINVVDGIMVARGDLGIEVPAQKVPIIQKQLIQKCLQHRKPVIVATQMLESMIVSRRPTRAEVSDVANAVIDHTDAVMLSGESATGKYPMETVKIMAQTIHEAERSKFDDYTCPAITKERDIKSMIAHAASDILQTRQIKLVMIDADADLVRLIASHRPEVRLIGFSNDATLRQQLNIVRGVTMYRVVSNPYQFLKKNTIARRGDMILTVEEDEIEIKKLV
ncbi:pyruvate kinase [Candidatus Uhrbacteria bacterium]|nr:pyruvate kinase [Candidatus Uhrbacteria bacterium]